MCYYVTTDTNARSTQKTTILRVNFVAKAYLVVCIGTYYGATADISITWFHIFPVTYSYCISREICHETIAFLTTCFNRLQQPSDDDDNVVVVKSIIKNSVIT